MSFYRESTQPVVNPDTGLPYISEEIVRMNQTATESDHFPRHELECHCGCGEVEINYGSLMKLETTRIRYGKPFVPNCAYRCQAHNDTIKGASKTSSHTKGYAFDIPVENDADRWRLINAAIDAGFTRIGIYSNFIHLDDDPDKNDFRIWWGKY